MAGFTVSPPGQELGTGARYDLFLEVFSGLVLNAFNTKQTTMDKQVVRTITHGKSAQFPAIWKAAATYFTPGDELGGQVIAHGAKIITIEELLVADVFVDELDELLNHYAIRSEYALQLGEALANQADTNTYRAIHKAARTAHWSTEVAFDGTEIEDANLGDTTLTFQAAMYTAAKALDEKDISEDNRYVAMKPAHYFKLLEGGEFLNRDFGNEGNGSQARAIIESVAGLQVIKTNNLPQANDSGNAAVPSTLRYDFSIGGGATFIACAWHPSAIGMVSLMGLRSERQYDARYQGTLLLSKYAMGQDYLRTESAVTLGDSSGAFE